MIRMLIAALVFLVLVAGGAAAASIPCAGSAAEQSLGFGGAKLVPAVDADTASQQQDQASPCHDHCKSAPRGITRMASTVESSLGPARQIAMAPFVPDTVIPPPR